MFKSLFCTSLATLAVLGAVTAVEAAPNAVIATISQAPVTVLTYGMHNLRHDLQGAFVGPEAAPYSIAAAPLTGPIADIVTLLYGEDAGTITLNLVKIAKLPDGVSPDDACTRAMAALRNFAHVDPISAKPSDGMDSSMLAYYFTPKDRRLMQRSRGPRSTASSVFATAQARRGLASPARPICWIPTLPWSKTRPAF